MHDTSDMNVQKISVFLVSMTLAFLGGFFWAQHHAACKALGTPPLSVSDQESNALSGPEFSSQEGDNSVQRRAPAKLGALVGEPEFPSTSAQKQPQLLSPI